MRSVHTVFSLHPHILDDLFTYSLINLLVYLLAYILTSSLTHPLTYLLTGRQNILHPCLFLASF